MAYIQGAVADRTVYLTLSDVPATGIAYTAVTIQIKKQGQFALSTKTLQPGDWTELGGGMYMIAFSATDMSTVGDFMFTLNGAAFDNFVYDEFTIEPAPAGGSSVQLPSQCIVSGNLSTIMGTAPSQEPIKIVAYTPQFPAKYSNTILTGDAAWTFADALGNFSLPLVQNSVVIIVIKRAGIRSQITVPASPTANLLDLLAPFTIDYSV